MTESPSDREKQIPLGMLTKQDIAFLIQEKQIIQNCVPANLGKAVYEMRLGSFAFRWEKDGRQNIRLGNQQNSEKELKLPPNSLTFVTTLEKFNLPEDIIARFNLKVDWVHRGLLLGTGPIVNPGFDKYLLIPIHNFSSKEVQIGYGKKLIAVEFTKIIPAKKEEFDFESQNIEDDVETLVEPYSKEAMLVESSVYRAIQEARDETEKSKQYRKVFTWIGAFAILGVSLSIAALIFSALSFHNDTQQRISTAQNVLISTSEKLEQENNNMRKELNDIKEQLKTIQSYDVNTTSGINPQRSNGQANTNTMKVMQQEDQKIQLPPSSEGKDLNTPK